MKAVTWHGQRDVRVEEVQDPEIVNPRDGIMVVKPERKASTLKSDVDGRVPTEVQLASAEAIFAYRPIDVVADIAPRALMLICTEGDAVTPEEHAFALYERFRPAVPAGVSGWGAVGILVLARLRVLADR